MASAETEPVEGAPPLDAVQQADGSFVQERPDGSTLRWTKRPDGSWRKPERARSGTTALSAATANLERQKISPPRTALQPPEKGTSAMAAVDLPETANRAKEQEAATPAETPTGAKHPLQHRWNLWIHQRPGQAYAKEHYGESQWSDGQRDLHEFATAEDYWCMVNNMHKPSKLASADYSLFKHNISPAWEDPNFKRGGRWTVKLEKLKTETLDELWVLLTMALVGEGFADYAGDAVCGAIVQVRNRGSKAALWVSESSRVERILAIGHRYRQILQDVPGLANLEARCLQFEYFGRQHHAMDLPELFKGKSTVGVFQ